MAMSGAEYLKSSKLNVAAIKSPGDVLMLAMQRVAARYTSRAVVVAIPSTNTVPAPSIVACWDGAPAVKPDSTIRLH